ncbi:MAG TPA: hypothetical protein VIF43_01515 [Patescibacteria group bacterium]|jgi:hypothetical protein
MTATTAAKEGELTGNGSQLDLVRAILNPLETFEVDVRGLEPKRVVKLKLKVRGVVLVDGGSQLIGEDLKGTAYLIFCNDSEKRICYIEVPWLQLQEGDLKACRLAYCDQELIDEHLKIKLAGE